MLLEFFKNCVILNGIFLILKMAEVKMKGRKRAEILLCMGFVVEQQY